METPRSPLIKILSLVPWAERIFMVAAALALALSFTGNPSTPLLVTSLVSLGVSFFLTAFIPMDIPYEENDRLDFIHLFTLTIAPKIVYIGMAIAVMAILINQLGLPPERYLQFFLASGFIIAGSFLVIIVAWAKGVKHIGYILPMYYRALPVLLVMAYLYFKP